MEYVKPIWLPSHLFALRSLQDPEMTDLQSRRPLGPKGIGWISTQKSTIDQVVLLTQNIENSFEAKKKAGAVFVDLTAAYDTVWHRGLACKLLRLLPDKHMVRLIMELFKIEALP